MATDIFAHVLPVYHGFSVAYAVFILLFHPCLFG